MTKSTSGLKRVANLGNIVYYKLMTLFICQNNRLADVHVFKNSKHIDHQCKSGYDRTNALVSNAEKYCQLTYIVPL